MSEFGVVSNPNTVRLERTLPGSPADVWSYLTDPEKRGTWLAAGPMELEVGGAVELRFDFKRLTSEAAPERFRSVESGHIQCGHITQCDPPHLLSFTWNEQNGSPSEVRFDLAAHGDKTKLIVTHSRLPNKKEMISVAGGWHTHLGLLEARLNRREPDLFWTTFIQRESEYRERMRDLPEHTA